MFPYIYLSGSAYERGFQHGTQCKELIGLCLNNYKYLFQEMAGTQWKDALLRAEEFIPLIEQYDMEIMEEIRGIADGAGRPLLELVALNARTEIALNPKGISGCTALGIAPEASANGETLLAQNWDWMSKSKDTMVVIEIEQYPKPKIIMITEAGIVGKIGFNSRGVGVVFNSLMCEENELGIPVHILLRGILNSGTLSEAIGAVVNSKSAAAANFMIGHSDGEVLNLEIRPSDFEVIGSETGVLAHANHFVGLRSTKIKEIEGRLFPDTFIRTLRAKKLLNYNNGQLTVEKVKTILENHVNYPYAICRHIPQETSLYQPSVELVTVFSVIINLSAGTLYLAEGTPCNSSYYSLNMK